MPYHWAFMAEREFAPGRSHFTAAADKSSARGKSSPEVGKHSLPRLSEKPFSPKVVDYAAFLADKEDEGGQTVLAFVKATSTQAAVDVFTKHGDRQFTLNLKNLIDVDGREGLPLPSKQIWLDQIGEHRLGLEGKGEFIAAEQRLKITMFLRVVPPILDNGIPKFIPLQIITLEINLLRTPVPDSDERGTPNKRHYRDNKILQASATPEHGAMDWSA